MSKIVQNSPVVFFYFICICVMLMTGCSTPPRKRVLWPVYPATPRIEWLGTYASEDSFPKDGMQRFAEGIFGKVDQTYLKSPYGIVRDSKGLVYVADNADGRILVYDMVRHTVSNYSEEPYFTRPAGLAVDEADNLYVVDTAKRVVLVFDEDRQPLRTLGSPSELSAPGQIAIDQDRNRIYVSDPRKNKIFVYDRNAALIQEIGPYGKSMHGEFTLSSPQGMAIDHDGNLWVAELLGARVSLFGADGEYLRSFGERGDAVFQFEAPKDLAFDSDENLWVIDNRRPQIYTYNSKGSLLLATGTSQPSPDPLGFSAPTSIFIANDDTVYVTDRVNRRFSVWRYLNERYLVEHPLTEDERKYFEEVGKSAHLSGAGSAEKGSSMKEKE